VTIEEIRKPVKVKAPAETFRYHASLVTVKNPMGGKKFLESTAPKVGEDGWQTTPIPPAPVGGVESVEHIGVADKAALDISVELTKAFNRGVATNEAKVAEAYRLGNAEATNKYATTIGQLRQQVKLAEETGYNKGLVDGKQSAGSMEVPDPEAFERGIAEGRLAMAKEADGKVDAAYKQGRDDEAEEWETNPSLPQVIEDGPHATTAPAEPEPFHNEPEKEVEVPKSMYENPKPKRTPRKKGAKRGGKKK